MFMKKKSKDDKKQLLSGSSETSLTKKKKLKDEDARHKKERKAIEKAEKEKQKILDKKSKDAKKKEAKVKKESRLKRKKSGSASDDSLNTRRGTKGSESEHSDSSKSTISSVKKILKSPFSKSSKKRQKSTSDAKHVSKLETKHVSKKIKKSASPAPKKHKETTTTSDSDTTDSKPPTRISDTSDLEASDAMSAKSNKKRFFGKGSPKKISKPMKDVKTSEAKKEKEQTSTKLHARFDTESPGTTDTEDSDTSDVSEGKPKKKRWFGSDKTDKSNKTKFKVENEVKDKKKSKVSSKTSFNTNMTLPSIPHRIGSDSDASYSSSDDLGNKKNILLPHLNDEETHFLELVASGDVAATNEYYESNKEKINVNCINFQGLSALHLAVQSRSEPMVAYLLEQKDIDISDTVLHAIRDNQLKILKMDKVQKFSAMLLDAQNQMSPGLEFAGVTHSTDFPDYVTPLVLAAQCGHYEAVALLVSRGHTIERPHPPDCTCKACRESLAAEDALHRSSNRLSLYRAVASPSYIVHTAPDPILAVFKLSAELDRAAAADRQMSAAYLHIKEDLCSFAVELIGYCRSSDEVKLLLKQTSGSRGRRHFILPRLLMAMDYKQKEFVAHPNTQQVLESYWIGNMYKWRGHSMLMKAAIVVTRVLITPVILIMTLFMPYHRWTKHYQIPLNKLITHVAAYFVFLIIVFLISNEDKATQKRGPPSSPIIFLLVFYVFGYIWSAIRTCLIQGPKRYFREMWNWADLLMLVLFITTFAFWIAAAIDVKVNGNEDLERKYWNEFDPTLLAEGTFCFATIIAYFRLMFLCQLNYHLGPLQVSLGKMTADIYKFIILYGIIIMAFTAGLSRLYQYYDGMIYEDDAGMKTAQVSSFTSFTDTLNTLFWALFCMSPIESADVVIENDKKGNATEEVRHRFTEKVGYISFACFEVMSVIVVLNMLIATMSNTFQKVTDNVAIEWTFGRTEVYIDYITQTTVPTPYNLIPTLNGLTSIFSWCTAFVTRRKGVRAKFNFSHCCYIEKDVERNLQRDFPILMSMLVQRYFRDKESTYTTGTGMEGELEGLRREIVTLKTIITEKV